MAEAMEKVSSVIALSTARPAIFPGKSPRQCTRRHWLQHIVLTN